MLESPNFRSSEPTLDVINAVFAERFGDAHLRLVAAREQTAGADTDAGTGDGDGKGKGNGMGTGTGRGRSAVEMLLSGHAGWGSEQAGEDGVPDHWRRAEARRWPADRGAGGGREAAAGDVVVLLRAAGASTSTSLRYARRACGRWRALGRTGSGWRSATCFLPSRAGQPADELALYATPASPLVGLSADTSRCWPQRTLGRRRPVGRDRWVCRSL